MMREIFFTFVEISISVSVLIAALLLLKPFLARRYAARWRYWIWIVLALRLMVPFRGIEWAPGREAQPQTDFQTVLISEKSSVDSPPAQVRPQGWFTVEIPEQMTAPIGALSPKGDTSIALLDIVAIVWMTGCIGVLSAHLLGYARYRRRALKRGVPMQDAALLRRMFQLKMELQIRDSVSVIEYSEATSPMMTGFLKPVLILPQARYSPEELYFILKHELIHLKRRDVYIKLLFAAAAAVHWFNPLIWIMQREASVEMELSCDERVTKGAGYAVRKAYTETLLSSLHRQCGGKTVLSTQFYGGKRIMKMRFQNILIRNRKKNGIVIFLCAAILAMSLGTLVGCSVAKDKTEDAPNQAGSGNEEGAAGQPEEDGQAPRETGSEEPGLSASGPEDGASQQSPEAVEKLAYIADFDGKEITFDEIEWVQVPSERASELGITQDDAPSGFSVYNEEAAEETMSLAADCVCKVLDWTSNFEETQVSPEELRDILAEREGTVIPYHLTIRDHEIVGITEQYVP